MELNNYLIAILYVVIALTGYGLKEYIKKKASTLATNENFDELKDQLSETTKLTKDIEAKVANDAWVVQQKWLAKKDFYLNALKIFNCIDAATSEWYSANDERLERVGNTLRMDDTYNSFLQKQEQAHEEIIKNKKKLNDLLTLEGFLFLNDNLIEIIKEFTEGEERRAVKILSEHFEKEDRTKDYAKETEVLLKSERLTFVDLMSRFEMSFSAFKKVAKEDLNLIKPYKE